MPFSVNAFNHAEWERYSLQDFGDFSEMVEYVNQRPDYGDCDCGDWFYIPDEPSPANDRVIYFGSFGNDHSPGASAYTYAELFDMDDKDDSAEFERRKQRWESAPEYLESGDDDDTDDWDEEELVEAEE
jgi:hypothetical protein